MKQKREFVTKTSRDSRDAVSVERLVLQQLAQDTGDAVVGFAVDERCVPRKICQHTGYSVGILAPLVVLLEEAEFQ